MLSVRMEEISPAGLKDDLVFVLNSFKSFCKQHRLSDAEEEECDRLLSKHKRDTLTSHSSSCSQRKACDMKGPSHFQPSYEYFYLIVGRGASALQPGYSSSS